MGHEVNEGSAPVPPTNDFGLIFFSWSIGTWFCEFFFISVVTVYTH